MGGKIKWEMSVGVCGTVRCFWLWRRMLVPATHNYGILAPWGSHPLTDVLWSTESMRVIHYGAEVTRIQKIMREIAGSRVARDHLRVCWENRRGQSNCGECEKCIRTIVALKIAGVLEQCPSFDRLLRYADVAHMTFASPGIRLHMLYNYEAALAARADPLLIRALRRCVYPSLAWRCWHAVCRWAKAAGRGADRVLMDECLRQRHRAKRAPGGPKSVALHP